MSPATPKLHPARHLNFFGEKSLRELCIFTRSRPPASSRSTQHERQVSIHRKLSQVLTSVYLHVARTNTCLLRVYIHMIANRRDMLTSTAIQLPSVISSAEHQLACQSLPTALDTFNTVSMSSLPKDTPNQPGYPVSILDTDLYKVCRSSILLRPINNIILNALIILLGS